MHFIDRTLFSSAPLAELATIHSEEQPKWLAYKSYKKNPSLPVVSKPNGKWKLDIIRDPLITLFKSNCAYCGDFAQKDNDGEVDHFLPKEIDDAAERIYDWSNYVWACHSCNNRKRTHYPLIDPCNCDEVRQIYFHSADGRYIVYPTAKKDIKEKFALTVSKTLINGKMSPQRRRNIYTNLTTIFFKEILLRDKLFKVENINDPSSRDTKEAYENLKRAKDSLKDYLNSKEYVLLKFEIFQSFKDANPEFNYNYEDFIDG